MCSKNLRRLAAGPALLALLLPLVLLVSGCGKKGDPLPPLRTIPIPTKDLQVRQQGRTILLEMAYPSTTVGGQALGGIDAVELHALTRPPQSDGSPPPVEPQEFQLGAELLVTLRGAELGSATVGDRLEFRLPLADPLPEEPVANIFAVRTLKGTETSGFSNRVSLVPGEPPAAPQNLGLEARPKAIVLSWDWPEDLDDPEGFDIFRRLAQEKGYGKRLFRLGGSSRTYNDGRASYGNRYIYTVRTVGNVRPLVHSEPAGEREIDYEDRFAPRLPKNFVALAERGSVRLRWDPSDAPDTKGYVVYRKGPSQDDFVRITRDPILSTEYLDTGLASGLRFEYKLQTVDTTGNESDLSAPVAATTR